MAPLPPKSPQQEKRKLSGSGGGGGGTILLEGDSFGAQISQSSSRNTSSATLRQRPMTAEDIKKQKEQERWLHGTNSIRPRGKETPRPTQATTTATDTTTPVESARTQSNYGGGRREEGGNVGMHGGRSAVRVGAGFGARPKKKVSWPADHKLAEVREFEKDEPAPDEAGQEHQHLSPAEARKREVEMERGFLLEQKAAAEEKWMQDKRSMMPTLSWYPPLPYELPSRSTMAPRGAESTEAETQRKRDAGRLAEHYFKPELIPPSPREPEDPQNPYPDNEVLAIPWFEPFACTPQPQQQPSLASLLAPTAMAMPVINAFSSVAQLLQPSGLPADLPRQASRRSTPGDGKARFVPWLQS
jgi:hypothetical protein